MAEGLDLSFFCRMPLTWGLAVIHIPPGHGFGLRTGLWPNVEEQPPACGGLVLPRDEGSVRTKRSEPIKR